MAEPGNAPDLSTGSYEPCPILPGARMAGNPVVVSRAVTSWLDSDTAEMTINQNQFPIKQARKGERQEIRWAKTANEAEKQNETGLTCFILRFCFCWRTLVQVRTNLLLKSFDGKPVAYAYKVLSFLLPALFYFSTKG